MRLLPSALPAFFLLTICAANALADEATTYAGTLGKTSIVVELTTAHKDGAFFGRYAYMIKGLDIPLHGMKAGDGLTLKEEKPCTDKNCRMAAGNLTEDAPIGAEWSLKSDSTGEGLEGIWTDKESGKSLPVKLSKKGVRSLPDEVSSADMLDPTFSPAMQQDSTAITAKDLPYDVLKLDHPAKKGKVVVIGDSAYRIDLDSRANVDSPVVIRLGKVGPMMLNRRLLDLRLRWMSNAFRLSDQVYLTYGWNGSEGTGTNEPDIGSLQVTVDYLTPRLMGITESDGLHWPSAHSDTIKTHEFIDVRTGKLAYAKDLLRDWVARDADGNIVDPAKLDPQYAPTWGPSDKLAQYVLDHRNKSDTRSDDDCGLPDAVKTNLDVYFRGDKIVFELVGPPTEAIGCGGDLAEIPIKNIGPFLTKAGARYFAEFHK